MSKAGHHSPKGQYTSRDHYTEVTNQIIAALEAGTPPWRKPWDTGKARNPLMPCNAVTGMRYRGINVVTLATSPLALAAADPRWATYKQAADRGWQVRNGARGNDSLLFQADRGARSEAKHGIRRGRKDEAYTAAACLHIVSRESDRGHSRVCPAECCRSALARL